jgi:hypothetical protein
VSASRVRLGSKGVDGGQQSEPLAQHCHPSPLVSNAACAPLVLSCICFAPAVANQRADTHGSLCNPDCEALNLPREIILIKMVPRDVEEGEDPKNAACDMETVTKTKNAHSKGHIILLQIPKACKAYQNSQEIWDLLQTLKPVMVLISLPTEEDSHVGPLYYRNKQTPVLWLREEDGHGLAAVMTASPASAVRVMDLPGAELVAVKAEYAGQPALTSALGPVSH